MTDGVVEPLSPDRCRITTGSWSWVGLAASVGRFGVAISDVSPPELAAAFGELARRYADASAAGR